MEKACLSFSLFLIFFSLASSGNSLSPMEYYNSLVAGGDDPGYRDGSFSEARFNQPTGLAFDDSGNRLFVADSNNNCIRVIHLDAANQVETLAGSIAPGNKDGLFLQASFNQPTVLTFIPDNRLVVYDSGNHLLRIMDLKTQAVSTLAGNKTDNQIGAIWNMVYSPKDGGLYFSERDSQKIRKLDLKTSLMTTILAGNSLVSRPMALCLMKDQLYVADQSLPDVYRVDMLPTTTTAQASVSLVEVGKGDQIQELASSDGILYALQAGTVPLARILPAYQPVTLTTPWGFMIDAENPGVRPFISFQPNMPVGFAASPGEARKLYVSQSLNQCQSVLSIKDYMFEDRKYSVDPNDFSYPEAKPPNTFRILVLSDSRMVRTSPYIPGLRAGDHVDLYNNMVQSLRINTFSKQLEFLLNREAALRGSPIHFEVLMYAHLGQSFSDYINRDIPPFVKKYDVDMVLGLAGWPGYKNYFEKPVGSNGIPSDAVDPTFLLKPLADRIPPGAPARFYQRLLDKKLVQAGKEPSPGPPSEPDSLAIIRGMDTEIRDDMIEMDGRILKIFNEKLRGLDAPKDHPRSFLIFYAPWWDYYSLNDAYESYWRDVCGKYGLNFLDLSASFYALETSFYPTHDSFADNHYNMYGNALLAYLLSYYLPEQKWIP
jgi:sugar lactone lactonase YvrE